MFIKEKIHNLLLSWCKGQANSMIPTFSYYDCFYETQRNHADNHSNHSFNSSELSAVISSDEFTKSEIVLIINTIPLFHWNNHNKKILESLNLLGPLECWTSFVYQPSKPKTTINNFSV